jgi:hypothetical protein
MKERSPAPNPPARDGTAVEAVARVEGLVEFTRTARLRSRTEVLEAVARAASGVAGFANVAVSVYRPAWDNYETAIVLASEEAQRALLGTTNPRDSVRPAVLRTEPRVPRDYVLIAASSACQTAPHAQSLTNPEPLPTIAFRARAEARNQRIGLARPAPRWRSRCHAGDR